ncbi:MAG: alanine racemase [Pseudomonadota bacterium]
MTELASNLNEERLAALELDSYRLDGDIVDTVMSPALVVFMGQVRRNIARMSAHLGGDMSRWRPHLKTTKIPEIYAELLQAGVRAFKCATAREAEVLLSTARQQGFDGVDVLLAYAYQGPQLRRAGALARAFPEASVAVLTESSQHAESAPPELGLFIDINSGMNRTGLPKDDRAGLIAVASAAGERLRGLHYYDGHIHEATPAARCAASHAIYAELVGLYEHLHAAGMTAPELITSGTLTFIYALAFEPFAELRNATRHRVSPGTVVFHDFQSDSNLSDLDLMPAALILSRVISHPAPDIATCDAGSKSVAAEAGHPVAFVLGRPDLVPMVPSEEHLPLRAEKPDTKPARGDVVLLIPRHVCPTVNLAETALLVEEDGSTRAVSVAARAHELFFD